MTDRELLECLKDRPCEACKFHSDKGCSKWDCVFDGKRTIPRIRRDGCRDPLCSNCFEAVDEKWDYCPNCGAKMVEPQERSEE